MASPVAEIIERASRDSKPDEVEQDLAALWREIARSGPAVARALMANFVVLRFTAPAAPDTTTNDTDATIEAVAGLHPSRTIVIEHEPGDAVAEAPSAASVAISVFGSASARYGVERILVRSACANVSLASIVRRFVYGDRPTSLWWTEDLSRSAPDEGLVDFARQLLYDSRRWADVPAGFQIVGAFAEAQRVDLADLNWRRLDALRRALGHAAAGVSIAGPLRIAIACREDENALGWLLAGWLTARLRLDRDAWPSMTDTPADGDILTLTIEGPSMRLTAAMNEHRVLVSCPDGSPLVVATAHEPPAEAMAAELRMLSRDAALTDAVIAIRRMLV